MLAVGGAGALLVIVFLVALIAPAIQQARAAARRSQCKNNLKAIGLALQVYHDRYSAFPPAYIPDENGKPMHSWRVLILPFVDEQALYDQYKMSESWDSPANRHVLENMPDVFRCPSDASEGTTTNYAAPFGPNCVFRGAEPVRLRDIIDGTSNTIVVGEVSGAGIPWTKPADIDVSNVTQLGTSNGFSSQHVGGCQFAFADGSTRFISNGINPRTLMSLFTLAGSEPIGRF